MANKVIPSTTVFRSRSRAGPKLIEAVLRQAKLAREQLTQTVVGGRQEEFRAMRDRLEVAVRELVSLAKECGIPLA